jgi:sarcosine oxidase
VKYDVIVAGLGAMGSATAAQCALRSRTVLGLERWSPGHRYGSSHGDSRIIREMYFEHPMYVPLLQRAYELWAQLEQRTGEKLSSLNGGLMIGRKDGMLVTGTLRSAREHGLKHEMLTANDVKERYPAFDLQKDLVAVVDPRAGWLDPERCNAAHLDVAKKCGADLRYEEPVLSWAAADDGVTVTTSCDTYHADHLVLTVGACTPTLLNGLELPLEVERQAVFWFDESGPEYDASRFPIWAYEYTPGAICYGFPHLPRGVKASVMHGGETYTSSEEVNRTVRDPELDALRAALQPVLPALSKAKVTNGEVCLFTNTPDHDFIIDWHPQSPRVLISSPCSGHGFKFASVIGEVQANLVSGGDKRFDLKPFSIGRFKS